MESKQMILGVLRSGLVCQVAAAIGPMPALNDAYEYLLRHAGRMCSGGTVATIGPGDFFGEMSVLDGRPRTASVIADGPTTCLALPTWDFEAVLRDEPSVAIAILRELAGRLRDLTEADRH